MIHMMIVTLIKMINKMTRTTTMMAMVMIMTTTTMMTKTNDEHINIAATKDTFTGAQRAL